MLGDNVSSQLTSILDKISSQQFRIGQRLQWAAGANPAINSVIDEFERAMNRRKQILQQEEELYLQICEFCEAVIHLESSHTRVSNKTENDKDTIMLLQRCASFPHSFPPPSSTFHSSLLPPPTFPPSFPHSFPFSLPTHNHLPPPPHSFPPTHTTRLTSPSLSSLPSLHPSILPLTPTGALT